MSPDAVGPLNGLKVIELCDDQGAFAGKLLADMGADVVKVEPPAGDPSRGYAPFVDDEPGVERSLHFWHSNTSKRGITLDVEHDAGREVLRKLIANADMFIESLGPGRAQAFGLGYEALAADHPELIMASLSPFGQSGPRVDEHATDLTILAGGGPAWSCGYDDHSLPPVRGGGSQGYQTGCHFLFMSALVALLHRDQTGRGQYIDVNMHAAANVTTEAASYSWLVAEATVQRQTGRHAGVNRSMPSQIPCADGRWVNTGVPARTPLAFEQLHEWLEELGLIEEFPEAALLEIGAQRERIDLSRISEDPEVAAIFGAGREATNLIASRLGAFEFFSGAQERGFQVGIIYSPEEVMEDPHFVARGFPVSVDHPELDRAFLYPGAPYKFGRTPWKARRAPLLGEHNDAVFDEVGLRPDEVEQLKSDGVV